MVISIKKPNACRFRNLSLYHLKFALKYAILYLPKSSKTHRERTVKMLPIKLKMQAFASYAEAVEIDFTKLDSLFLIHGETGAGKTAVLDAVMYALYGESSGGDRNELRCALPAAEKLPTEVEFTFSVRGKLYTFTRSIIITPRSKKQESRQDCFYYEEDGTRRAFFDNPKQTAVREKAEELTGLSADQFRQVVILPQGKFERLLTSESKDKETILSALFGAEKYSRLSDKLAEKAEEKRQEIKSETAALNALLASEKAETSAQLTEEVQRLEKETEELEPQLEEAKKRLSEVRERLTAAEVLSEKFSAFAIAEKRLAELKGGEGKMTAAKTLLQKHENALKAKPEQTALAAAENALAARAGVCTAAEKSLAEAEKAYSVAKARKNASDEKEEENKLRVQELAVLESLAEVYDKTAAAEEAVRRVSAERADREKNRRITAGKLENTSAEIKRLTDMREDITARYSRALPVLSARLAALENGAAAAARLEKYTKALGNIRANVTRLEAEAETLAAKKSEAEKLYDSLYGEYLSDTAAELSSRLKEGMPCPVCGSTAHPKPAAVSPCGVTAGEVKAARSEFERLAKELSDKITAAAAEKARIPAAEDCIAAERKTVSDTGYTEAALKKAAAEHAEAVRQNDRLAGIDKKVAELTAMKAELEKTAAAEEEKLGAVRLSEAKAEAEANALKERLDPRFKDRAAYAVRVDSLRKAAEAFVREKEQSEKELAAAERRRIEAAAAFSQAETELAAAKKTLDEAKCAFAEKLAELNIPVEEYRNALLDEEYAVRLAAEAKRYDMELHAAVERADTLKAELAEKTPPPIDEIRAAAAESETDLAELSGKTAVTKQRLERLKRLAKEYTECYGRLEKKRESSDRLTAFAKFMHGDKGISFTRYVLSIMLSLVAEEANRILAEIHGGRFRLCVKTELMANSKQGLDLEVENITAERAMKYGVKNLSGGEKFLISLALSLGLSAVARSRNGGIDIEAMFIDEGFGSLDPASLREAVAILCGLAPGRNTVGIISHVEELKNVIPCSVRVYKKPDGSSGIAV